MSAVEMLPNGRTAAFALDTEGEQYQHLALGQVLPMQWHSRVMHKAEGDESCKLQRNAAWPCTAFTAVPRFLVARGQLQ